MALLSPVPAKKRAKTKAKPVTSEDALFRLIGIGKSGIPGGIQAKSTSTLLALIAHGNLCPFPRFRFENAESLLIAVLSCAP